MIVAHGNQAESIDLKLLGPLLRRRRVDLGQTLEEASQELGVCHQTLYKWEHGIRPPHLQLYPRIVTYLGYEPWPEDRLSFGARLRLARLRLGLSRQHLAERLGISWSAYERWEDGKITQVHARERRLLMEFLKTGIGKD
ncbi:MAG TPA: helix-turn-helix transcriptional regulator [Candidatus Sumerlaeota bacterium]|nr:helix-turn-helix transcriptional regulator [Candidatus Sumerlaeota bacterium]